MWLSCVVGYIILFWEKYSMICIRSHIETVLKNLCPLPLKDRLLIIGLLKVKAKLIIFDGEIENICDVSEIKLANQ